MMFVPKQSNLKKIKKNSLFLLVIVFLLLLAVTTASGATVVNIDPSSQTVLPLETFSVDVYCIPDQPIKSFEFKLSFNASLLQANSVTEGNIFSGYTTFFSSGTINNTAGTIINIYGLILGSGNVTAPGSFARISFTAKSSLSASFLHLYDLGVTDEVGYISAVANDGNVTIYDPNIVHVFSEITPSNGSTSNPITTSTLSIKIVDLRGDLFDFAISTSPNIGISSGNGETNGTKSCTVSGLSYSTTYNWYVNCKDLVSGEWTNASYWFETEDEPGQGTPPPGDGGVIIPPITKKNNPPNQPITPSGPTLVERDVVYEYSSYTYDVDGDQVKLLFDWGDGSYSDWSGFVASNTTMSMSHSWDAVSNYTIKVIAQDEKGLNSTWSEPLEVTISETGSADEPPYMEIKTPDEMVSNETVYFDASGSYDLNGVIVSYQWDFGDGETGIGINTTHTYKILGYYTVTLVVTDNDGNTYNTSIGVNVLSEFVEGNLQQGESFPIFTIVSVCIFIIMIFLIVRFRDEISLFLLDRRIRLLRPKEVSDVKSKTYKSVGKSKGINYYSTVTNRPSSVKKNKLHKGIKDDNLRKSKLDHKAEEISEERESFSGYDEFNVGDKVDKLINLNLKPDSVGDYGQIDTIKDIEKTIDNLDFIRLRKSKLDHKADEISEEHESFSKYDGFNVGDKIDKLVNMNLKSERVDDYGASDILEDIKRRIDDFYDVGDDAEYIAIEKKIDDLIRSKTKNEIN